MSDLGIDVKRIEKLINAFSSHFGQQSLFLTFPDDEKLFSRKLKSALLAQEPSQGMLVFHGLEPFAFSVVKWEANPGKSLKLMTLIDSDSTDLEYKILSTDLLRKQILGDKTSNIVITSQSRVYQKVGKLPPMPVGIVAFYYYLLALWKIWIHPSFSASWEAEVDEVLKMQLPLSCFTKFLYNLSQDNTVEKIQDFGDEAHFTLNLLHAGCFFPRTLPDLSNERTRFSLPVEELDLVIQLLKRSYAPIYLCTLEELPCLVNQTYPGQTGFAVVGDVQKSFQNLLFGAVWKKMDGGVVVRMHPTSNPFKLNSISNEAFEALNGQIRNLRELKFCNTMLPSGAIGILCVMIANSAHLGVLESLDDSGLDTVITECKTAIDSCHKDFHRFDVDAMISILAGSLFVSVFFASILLRN